MEPKFLKQRKTIDEELADKMVHLMLQADGFHTRQISLEGTALPILCPDSNRRRSHDVSDDTGQGETALFNEAPSTLGQNLRVHESLRSRTIAREVHHQDCTAIVDLWR